MSRSTRMVSMKLLTLSFVFSLHFFVSMHHATESFKNFGSCSYTVIISTSCSSPRYTRDQISLAFGDRYGNQIYAPRLDDPGTRAFEKCSSDTYEINGPCAYQICYIYLYRSGPDGWVPNSVKIFSHSSKADTFSYNTYVPESICCLCFFFWLDKESPRKRGYLMVLTSVDNISPQVRSRPGSSSGGSRRKTPFTPSTSEYEYYTDYHPNYMDGEYGVLQSKSPVTKRSETETTRVIFRQGIRLLQEVSGWTTLLLYRRRVAIV
ncbi:unnamed protein product [Cochlearia groenlandica]